MRASRLPPHVVAIAAIACGACAPSARVEERRVTIVTLKDCPVVEARAVSTLTALGDFAYDPAGAPRRELRLADRGSAIDAFPLATRALTLDVRDSASGSTWLGLSELRDEGPVPIVAWPAHATCSLTDSVEAREGARIGRVDAFHVMVAGGVATDGSRVPRTYVADLSSGRIEALPFGLSTRRMNPTITRFDARSADEPGAHGALVAGGTDPDTGEALDSAEVYVPAAGHVGDFEAERISLSERRSRHGAVEMASGETLLVGGDSSGEPRRTMEIVDPRLRRSRTSGVALLAVARLDPVVMRLATGEILVAGGVDGDGKPVTTLEWFSPDASRPSRRPRDLVAGRERGFVALPAGGALAVVLPDSFAPLFQNVWVIGADGTVEAGRRAFDVDQIRLFPGTGGAPLLFTGRRWMRWDPWTSSFLDLGPDEAPQRGPATRELTWGDPGLALWLDHRRDSGAFLTGFRHSARSRFAPAPTSMLVESAAGLMPDRSVASDAASVQFRAEEGLVLGPGASVFMTDESFLDLDVVMERASGTPELVLRASSGEEMVLGGAGCIEGAGATRTIAASRRGARVEVTVDGGSPRACSGSLPERARVTVGIRGALAENRSTARRLTVERR